MNYLFKSFRNNFWRLLELFDDVTRLQSPTMVEVSLKTWRISLRYIFSKCYKLIRLLPLTWKSKTFLFFECPETVSMITQIGLFHRVQVFLFLQALETGQAREMSKLCANFRTLITRTKGKTSPTSISKVGVLKFYVWLESKQVIMSHIHNMQKYDRVEP